MTPSDPSMPHLTAFVAKMQAAGLGPVVVETFTHYYTLIYQGETGLIGDRDIVPVDPGEVQSIDALTDYATEGAAALNRAVMVVLNGGLGTSMGLTGPKSLLPVKGGRSFLEIIVRRAEHDGVHLALMNSFNTHAQTQAALERIQPLQPPRLFLQHKFPKILRAGLAPAEWPPQPELEWNPPGHGDIYTALVTSGMLDTLLEAGIPYAFLCNADNLGATVDKALLGYFASHDIPFMMEVAERTPADQKGGHLARHRSGRLLLREIAQCPPEDVAAFQDIHRYRFFNTNNLWVNLRHLKATLKAAGGLRLPMIVNPKTLDPRDAQSPPVYQIETAMGAAIALFESASAVRTRAERFYPVKKCNELLALRSDCFELSADGRLSLHPARVGGAPKISLDPRYYGRIDQFDARFGAAVPSLLNCESLTIKGDIAFEAGIAINGRTTLENTSAAQVVVPSGTRLQGHVRF